ncbi:hypothetical protein GCM10023340_25490 [Nocardioides marinquilinus]|uniref:Methyltransferase domain-containing protein n=1 Tax=Nocardioides marinquilinus TaxID=1210400 RepID=A0ABP9PQ28_9ACTN
MTADDAGPDVEPDTKDWTWVLDRPCPDCGYDAATVDLADVGPALRANAAVWRVALDGDGATRRPRPGTWSPAEYACHVRDVHRVFAERVDLVLAEDEPTFANWDQDAAARAGRYDLADPATVAGELDDGAEAAAARYDAVPDAARHRRGRRDNGSRFTVETLARYHLHDVVHHAWDVRQHVTRAAYDQQAAAYRQASATLSEPVRAALDAYASALAPGARVLEIGSGGGRDAAELEARGLVVRRTDVTPGFVELLRAAGHEADVLDPLVDDLDPPPAGYDGVWANASLLHVARRDLPTVLTRLAAATRPGGVLRLTVKEGDGDGWSTHGSIGAPRSFTYWRRGPLEDVVAGAGWQVGEVTETDGMRGERWLAVVAYGGGR